MTKQLITIALGALLLSACNDSNKNIDELHPQWSYDNVIYELNTRQFTPEGTFKQAQAELPALKKLGVDILWLMPIYPIGKEERKGTLGSYYAISDYCDVNPEFGTMKDFDNFLSYAHTNGFKVILDWVANHTSPDAKWITDGNIDWYELDSLGKPIAPYDWTDVAKVNYKNPEMREAMIQAMKFWVIKGVDGFRCDVAGEVPTDFWETAVDTLKKYNPNIFMLAEAEKPELHNKAFDMSYSWELHHIMNKIAQKEYSADSLRTYYKRELIKHPKSAFRMNFTSNHDENSWNGTEFERMGNAVEQFAVLSYILPGMPLIYNGQEYGMDKRLEFFEKDTLLRDGEYKDVYFALYKALNTLKKDNIALKSGEKGADMIELPNSEPKSVYSICRDTLNNTVIGIFNFSDSTQTVKIDLGKLAGKYNEFGNNQSIQIASDQTIQIAPWGYKVYYKN